MSDPNEWPSERVDLLRIMFAAGASYSEIGSKLGVSRSAVAAKVARLKFPPRGNNMPRPKPPKPKRPAWYPPQAGPSQTNCTLFELRYESCRWPVQDSPNYLFCGRPKIAGSPYCLPHFHRAYRGPR